jgi:hypothetical protein
MVEYKEWSLEGYYEDKFKTWSEHTDGKVYQQSRLKFGLVEMELLVKKCRRGLITKSEFNKHRKVLETEYFGI